MKISVWTAVSADFGQRQNLQIPAAGTVHFSEHIIIKKQRKEWITAAFCNKNVKMYYKNLIKISPGKRLIFSSSFPNEQKAVVIRPFLWHKKIDFWSSENERDKRRKQKK